MTSVFKILFAIDLQHDYYTSGKCNDISIVPSPETMELLKNRQMMVKMVGNKCIVLIKVKDKNSGPDQDKPFAPLNSNEKFVFYLQLDRPVFTTITNIDNDLFGSRRFYFSNIFETSTNTGLHLSAPIDAYKNAENYIPGDMVLVGGGKVAECIKSTSGNNPAGDGYTSYWFGYGQNTFATKKDMYAFRPGISNFTAKTAAKIFEIRIFSFNPATKSYNKEVKIKNNSISVGDIPTKNVQVNLKNLPVGRYVIKINGDDPENGTDAAGQPVPFYLSDNIAFGNYLGVVEIFNSKSDDPAFSLLDANGKVKDSIDVHGKSTWLNYIIQFAGKMAIWKYLVSAGKINSIDDELNVFDFNKTTIDQQDIFQSNFPIKMSEKPLLFDLLLIHPVSNLPPPAPNPDLQVSGLISRINTDYFCTIYLNY